MNFDKFMGRVEGTAGYGTVRDAGEIVTGGEKGTESDKWLCMMLNESREVVGVRVLRELDQNLKRSEDNVEKGAWKRRARQAGKNEGRVTDEGGEMDCDKTNVNVKSGFRLRDEALPGKKNSQTGKKCKVGLVEANNCAQMVGDASKKWHQPDQ